MHVGTLHVEKTDVRIFNVQRANVATCNGRLTSRHLGEDVDNVAFFKNRSCIHAMVVKKHGDADFFGQSQSLQHTADGGSLGHIPFRVLHGFFGRRQIISEIGVDVDAYAHISRAGRKPGSPP